MPRLRWVFLLAVIALCATAGTLAGGLRGGLLIGVVGGGLAFWWMIAVYRPPPNTIRADRGNPISPHSRKFRGDG